MWSDSHPSLAYLWLEVRSITLCVAKVLFRWIWAHCSLLPTTVMCCVEPCGLFLHYDEHVSRPRSIRHTPASRRSKFSAVYSIIRIHPQCCLNGSVASTYKTWTCCSIHVFYSVRSWVRWWCVFIYTCMCHGSPQPNSIPQRRWRVLPELWGVLLCQQIRADLRQSHRHLREFGVKLQW